MLSLVIALFSGAVGGLVVAMIPETKNRLRNYIVLLFAASSAFFTWHTALKVFAGERVRVAGELGGLAFSIDPDPLGAVFGLIASTLWLFTAVYSFGYMAGKHKQRTFFTFFLMSLTMTLGVAFSGNLVALYLFYELLTFATYPLVIHERSAEAMKAGSKYILYSLSGAGAILIAIIFTYAWSGKLDFSSGPMLANSLGPGLNWLLMLFIGGLVLKRQ